MWKKNSKMFFWWQSGDISLAKGIILWQIFIFFKNYLLHFDQVLDQTKKTLEPQAFGNVLGFCKYDALYMRWCYWHVMKYAFWISDVVPYLGKSIMSNGRQHLFGFCNTVIEMYSITWPSNKGFNFAFISPPKECGHHLHHDPSAEFAHHTTLISSDVVDEDGACAVVISESSHSPGGCCDFSKNITWIMHVLPPYISSKQTKGGRNVFFSVFAIFNVSNWTSYLFKIC